MEKMTDEQLKREMPFDQYGRYAIIRDIINANRKNRERFRIIDVGGRGNIMKKFLPEDDVFYLDPYVDTEDENYIKGDGCAMPFENENFDWVVSGDTFEHIPAEKRKKFLEENIRAAKSGVVLAAPFFTPEVAQAEINANENYKIISGGEDHVWLKEHMQNGLPSTDDFEDILKEKKISFQKIGNNNLVLWQILIGIYFAVSDDLHDEIRKEFEEFNYFYNSDVFPIDNQEPTYRKIYFIKKDEMLKNLETNRKPIGNELLLKTIKGSLGVIDRMFVKNKEVVRQKNQIIQLNEIKLQRKEAEIESMKSSKFWKAKEKYMTIVKKIKNERG